jgi:uncharacterized protein YdcH (DUF465 family)
MILFIELMTKLKGCKNLFVIFDKYNEVEEDIEKREKTSLT